MTRELVTTERPPMELLRAQDVDDDLAERFAAMAAREAEETANRLRPNTTRNHDLGWTVWVRFCEEANIPVNSVFRPCLHSWVEWMDEVGQIDRATGERKPYATSTMRTYFNNVCAYLREN